MDYRTEQFKASNSCSEIIKFHPSPSLQCGSAADNGRVSLTPKPTGEFTPPLRSPVTFGNLAVKPLLSLGWNSMCRWAGTAEPAFLLQSAPPCCSWVISLACLDAGTGAQGSTLPTTNYPKYLCSPSHLGAHCSQKLPEAPSPPQQPKPSCEQKFLLPVCRDFSFPASDPSLGGFHTLWPGSHTYHYSTLFLLLFILLLAWLPSAHLCFSFCPWPGCSFNSSLQSLSHSPSSLHWGASLGSTSDWAPSPSSHQQHLLSPSPEFCTRMSILTILIQGIHFWCSEWITTDEIWKPSCWFTGKLLLLLSRANNKLNPAVNNDRVRKWY